MEIWKDVSLRLCSKEKGGNWHYVYHFVDRDEGNRIMDAMILK